MTQKKGEPASPESFDREMELTEHLAELRTRLIRVILYLAVGLVITWEMCDPILHALIGPIQRVPGMEHAKIIYTNFMEPVMLRLQIAAVSAVILVFPLLFKEAWGFISPALTRGERRGFYFVGPLCVVLFLSGVLCALWVIPRGMAWFMCYVTPGTELMQKLNDLVTFLVKCCLAFGITFQLPVVILFLGKIGMVNSRFLWKWWRQAVVIAAVVAAVVTPSQDAFTMTAMAVPVTGLYFLSILLVKFVEKPGGREEEAEE